MPTKITRYMELTIMQEGENFSSNKVLRIFRRSNSILKNFCELHGSTEDEQILGKCEKLSVGCIHVVRTARQ